VKRIPRIEEIRERCIKSRDPSALRPQDDDIKIMKTKGGYVYITTNKRHTVLYTGVTADIGKRIWEHKEKLYKNSFAYKYNADVLIYYENFDDIESAISREKQIKGWTRKKKIDLINRNNQNWRNLSDDL